jgi:hypothetical protein
LTLSCPSGFSFLEKSNIDFSPSLEGIHIHQCRAFSPNPTPHKKEDTRMRVRTYKPKRIFLETLEGYIEASRVKTLDNFKEVN